MLALHLFVPCTETPITARKAPGWGGVQMTHTISQAGIADCNKHPPRPPTTLSVRKALL